MSSTFNDELIKAGREILDKIGVIATTKYMKESGNPVPDKLTSRTGKTKEALLGNANSIRLITFEGDNAKFTYGVKNLPGINLLEHGGAITQKQRAYFWHKYMGNREEVSPNWKKLALGKYFTSRQIVQSAVRDVYNEAETIINKYTKDYLKVSIKRIIDGNYN